MNKSELLDMMGSIRDKYVLEAIESRSNTASKPKSHLRLHRIGLLAAVLAALLLLAGCVAVYLRLQDMSIGKDTYVQSHDEQGRAIEPTERVRDVINFAALMDAPAQKASTQWHEFTQSYDPDHALMTNEPDIPGIANNYEYIYDCYTQEMVDKLDEISNANQVKLLEARVSIDRWGNDIAMEALGRESLFREDAPAEPTTVQGMLYAPYNFRLMYSLTLTGEDAPWKKMVYVTEIYQHSGYLPCDSIWTLDLSEYQQWNYTTGQGIEVLLAMNSTGRGLMVCPKDAGVLIVSIDGNLTGSQYPEPDQVPGKEAMEAFAEVIDFDLTPSGIDPAVLQPKLDAAEAEYRAANTFEFEEPVYESYADLILEDSHYWWSPEYQYQYTYYDLDKDGEEELLLGLDGRIYDVLSLSDGKAQREYFPFSAARLCQDGNVEIYASMPFSAWRQYLYYSSIPKSSEDSDFSFFSITFKGGQWEKYERDDTTGKEVYQDLTQEEVDDIRAQYVPLELSWKNIQDFPLDESGQTLGEYLQTLKNPGNGELRERYAEEFRNDSVSTHYRILDINGDGVDDLLLSEDGEKFYWIWTCRYGQPSGIFSEYFYLCEDNVLEAVSIQSEYEQDGIVETEQHVFYRANQNFKMEVIGYAAYNKATASWQSDRDGTPMDAAEAEAILAKYPRIDQGMRPISELIG